MNGIMVVGAGSLLPFIATLYHDGVPGPGLHRQRVRTMYYPTIGGKDEWFRTQLLPHGRLSHRGGLPDCIALGMFLLNKTRFGRYNFAIGSNQEAARLSGVRVDYWKILIHATCGLFAGLAGIFMERRTPPSSPARATASGSNAIAAVVIGGTYGGRLWHHVRNPDRSVC